MSTRHNCKKSLIAALLLASTAIPTFANDMPANGAAAVSTWQSIEPKDVFTGHAEIDESTWQQHLTLGIEALERRIFPQAKAHLNIAINELRRHEITDGRLLAAKDGLAHAYLGEDQYEQAKRLFEDVSAHARAESNNDELASALNGLAQIAIQEEQYKKAETLCRGAMKAAEHAADDKVVLGRSLTQVGKLYSVQGLPDASINAYKRAISVLAQVPSAQYDLALAEYGQAMALHRANKADESKAVFDKAFAIIDKEAKLDSTLAAAPQVFLRWEEGNARARVVPDHDYPLRYLLINNLRIAAVPVRSEHIIAVVVSLANCSRSRMELSVGPVSMTQLAPKHKPFTYVPPQLLDVALEEQHVTELTWRRRWLNHIQKTRYIPGYLKNGVLDSDNFFGNNQFGPYGMWPETAQEDTPIVTREEFLYGKHVDTDPRVSDFLTHCVVGYHPTFLEPGQAKTGIVFFQQERFDKAKLRITVGNVIAEIPFDSAGPR